MSPITMKNPAVIGVQYIHPKFMVVPLYTLPRAKPLAM
jgi:hypothetical protein